MKTKLHVLLLALLTSISTYAQTNMDDFKKQFKGKSIEEIKEKLIAQNKDLERLIKLSSLSIKLTPGKVEADEEKTTESFSEEPKQKIIEAFNKKLNGLYFTTRVLYPNTLLGIDFSSSSIMYSVKDYDEYKFPEPTLKLKKIFYKNGKTANVGQLIGGRNAGQTDQIKGTSWIDSVGLEASYYYPNKLSFVNLSAKNPNLTLADGKITLGELKENSVDFTVSEEVKKRIIKVEGINSKGKAVEQSSSSSNSMNSNYSTKFLTSLYETGEKAIDKINRQTYKNPNELLEDLFNMIPKTDDEKPENLIRTSYSFRGNITSVNIYFQPTSEVNNYSFTLINKAERGDGFTVAENKKEKFGLLDESGKWIIEPAFDRLSFYKGNYYMGNIGDDGYRSIYWLDKMNKKLVPFKYGFYRSEAYFGKYFSIENGVNGPKGLVDMTTNKIMIEPVHANINLDGNFIRLEEQDGKHILFDKDLKQVMSFANYDFNIHGDYIFARKPYTKKEKFGNYSHLSNTDDIYDKYGKKINKEDYVIETFDEFGKDGLLLVRNQAGKNLYINTQGEVVIDGSKFEDSQFFSNGFAAVKNKAGNWGYINVKGELVIPFMYKGARNFSKISALVESESGYKLIDRNNKVIKIFKDGFSSYGVQKDAENLKYTNYDGISYGSNGKPTKEK